MTSHIINVVWGKSYVETFLKRSLPFQFAPGNLKNFDGKYILYTTREDAERIRTHPHFKQLESLLPVECRMITADTSPYALMTACHTDAIKQANREGAPLIFLSPDAILSAGLFSFLQDTLDQGKRLVAICSTRLSMEKMDPYLEPFSFSSLELAQLALQNFHPYIEKCFLKKGKTLERPSQIYFPLDQKNVLVRAFHLHPLLLYPRDRSALPPLTADGPHFLEKAVPDFQEWEVVTDCSKVALFELSRESFLEDATVKPLTSFRFFRWADVHVTAGHRFFAKHEIILGDGKVHPSWNETRQQAHHLIASLETPPLSFRLAKPFLILGFYLKKLGLVLTGKKRLPLKKILSHFRYILKTRSIPFS
ncbi:MAG: hypothetical protein KDK64_05340 [Chlamydiia bacterium]|nr:hypothetical protein [Chlamydiia bacterium]